MAPIDNMALPYGAPPMMGKFGAQPFGKDLSLTPGRLSEAGHRCEEIYLEPELQASLCHRGRRRLREIQNSSQALLKMDRAHGILRAFGSEASIAEVQRQLECLSGPQKPVAAAAWAELMRTRKMTDTTVAAVERIQQQSGCRVHIERSKYEVRLFGPKAAVKIADQLLDEFQQMCVEQEIAVESAAAVSTEVLQELAHACSVTFRIEDQRVLVLGLDFAVAEAAKEFCKYLINPEDYEPPELSASKSCAVTEALSKLQNKSSASGATSASTTEASLPHPWADDSDHSVDGFENPRSQPQAGFHTMTRQQMHYKDDMVTDDELPQDEKNRRCGTCGSTLFCTQCGAPNPLLQSGAISLAAYPYQMAMQVPMQVRGGSPAMFMKPATPEQAMNGAMPQMYLPMNPGMMQFCPQGAAASTATPEHEMHEVALPGPDPSNSTHFVMMPSNMVPYGMTTADCVPMAYFMPGGNVSM